MVLKLDSKLVILILLLVEGGRGSDHTEEGAPLSKFFFNCPGKGDVELDEEDEETTYTGVYGRMDPDRPAGTITTGFMTPGRGRYVHPTQKRTINPREAARLQGFPDNYRFTIEGNPPTSQLLTKWIGDAVPLPLGYGAALAALAPGHPRP